MLLLVNFVSGFRLEFMYMSFIESIRSRLFHLHGFQLLVLLPQCIEITCFVCTKRINLVILKQSSDRLVIIAKGFSKVPNLHMLIKPKNLRIFQNLGSRDFWRIANSVLNKGKSAIPPLFNGQRCCLLHLIRQNCLLKTFLRTNLDDSGISSPVFFSITNFKLHNISVTPKMVKKVNFLGGYNEP